ncbi:MAG: response regulator [Chloroflexi bacterium]|nr:response regulator [Chloroflexota bacterium]
MAARILVIEDNEDNLQLVRFFLERLGHSVLAAYDGLTGMEAARVEQPDLILLDMGIPEIDGWELAGRLKEDPETKDIPLVALTAYTLPGDKRRALQSGCDGYITKPINVAGFGDEIGRFLKK